MALHLLSETEKNNLAQLVNVMVSYSITYKNMKSDSLSSNLGHEAVLDASVLSFEPPIGEFITYKVSSFASCFMACNFIHYFMILTCISISVI